MYKGAEYYENPIEKSGKMAELFLFGRVKIDNPDYERGLKACLAQKGQERIDCEFELIKKFQPFDPNNPQKKFMRDLLEYFRGNAGFKDEKDRKRARIFTAIDSIVDKEQGTDVFIEIEEKDSNRTRLSGDGTLNAKKVFDEYSKADVDAVFNIADIPDSQEKQEDYMRAVQKIGQEFVKRYLEKQRVH